jgi:hypothetical protein
MPLVMVEHHFIGRSCCVSADGENSVEPPCEHAFNSSSEPVQGVPVGGDTAHFALCKPGKPGGKTVSYAQGGQ